MRIEINSAPQETQTTARFVIRLVDSKPSNARTFLIMASIACMKDILRVKTPLTDMAEHYDVIDDCFENLEDELEGKPVLQAKLSTIFDELALVIKAEIEDNNVDVNYYLKKVWKSLVESGLSFELNESVLEAAIKLFQKIEFTKVKNEVPNVTLQPEEF